MRNTFGRLASNGIMQYKETEKMVVSIYVLRDWRNLEDKNLVE